MSRKNILDSRIQDIHKKATEGFTLTELAVEYGVTKAGISSALKRNGLTIPRHMPHNGRKKSMLRVKDEFIKLLDDCSTYIEAANKAGESFSVIRKWCKFHKVEANYCYKGKNASAYTTGQTASKAAGGRIILNSHASGYSDFNPRFKRGQVFRARAVFEMEVLKGLIPEGYVTHHINQNCTDDRPENIAMMTVTDHARIHHLLRHFELMKTVDQEDVALYEESEKLVNEMAQKISRANVDNTHIEEAFNMVNLVDKIMLEAVDRMGGLGAKHPKKVA